MPTRDPRYTPFRTVACTAAYPASMTTATTEEREPLSYLKAASPTCMILIGENNSYVEASAEFCRLVGYSRAELLRMKLEDLAAPGTADITNAFNPLTTTGCAQGLWLLVSREGTRILVRYESRLRSDLLMQTQLELIGAGY
jgi:PAS domain S-box-containing protein